ncbi:MAG: ABC transporter ATP-binding protein [Anaerolineales bacterium]|nr:ABC transporter ATP-binding protein [Anaerolineales bacterium]
MKEIMINVENLQKRYGDVTAVDDISFSVRKGEIFGLLGPNGAGKTTTLESLEGLRRPDSGRLQVAGVNPTREFRRLRGVIGVQLQSSGLAENISPAEAMRFFCSYHGVEPREDLLVRLGLSQKRRSPYSDLSVGQQRRLVLALALAHEPDVLFLDEPTAGLDVATRAELHAILREQQAQGTTILLATHDMAEAEEMADRIAILLDGRIAATGTPMEITARGAGLTKVSVRTERASLKEPAQFFPAVQKTTRKDEYCIFFSTDIGPTLSAIIQHVDAHEDKLIDLRVERPSLEDRFLEITKNGDPQ